ncbi:MAG: glycosyltransferase family 2 protein, partial [Chloroflexi bacterium]|nr:glycosyltransferase family 2 protein [Chloroflexota bacterium]
FAHLIVTYNSAKEIPDLLSDLQRLTRAGSGTTIVIDNHSQDDSARIVKTMFPDVCLIENPDNIGFARAVNQGFERCDSEHVFLLNPDMRIFQADFHQAMLDCIMGDPKIAAVGPLQFTGTGRARRLNFTWSYYTLQAFGVYLSHLLKLKVKLRSAPLRTTFLNAGCLLLRKSAFERVGQLNEKYSLYGEEPDLFLKFKLYGYECRLHPGVEVVHYRDRSLNTLPPGSRLIKRLRGAYNIADALGRGYARIIRARLLPRGSHVPPA